MSEENITRAEFEEKIRSLTQAFNDLRTELLASLASKAYVAEYIDHMLGDMIPINDPFSENSKIAGYELLDVEKVLKQFTRASQYYNLNDIRSILMSYDKAARMGNVNPYIAIAQMVKETDWTRSWWSRRPRRNPAGLGVTGVTSVEKPANINGWAHDDIEGIWKQGNTFPSWEIASMAHIGHLLTYLYTDEALTSDQRILVDHDPRRSSVTTNRGKVKILKDLDGKWSDPGIGYGRSIATLANALKK